MNIDTVKNFFLTDDKGLELTEYAVGAALIAVACVLAFTGLGTAIAGVISGLTTTITS